MGNRTRWYQTLGMDTRHKARACAYLSAAEIEHTGSAWCSRTVHAISVLKNLTVPCTLPYIITGGRGPPHQKPHVFAVNLPPVPHKETKVPTLHSAFASQTRHFAVRLVAELRKAGDEIFQAL